MFRLPFFANFLKHHRSKISQKLSFIQAKRDIRRHAFNSAPRRFLSSRDSGKEAKKVMSVRILKLLRVFRVTRKCFSYKRVAGIPPLLRSETNASEFRIYSRDDRNVSDQLVRKEIRKNRNCPARRRKFAAKVNTRVSFELIPVEDSESARSASEESNRIDGRSCSREAIGVGLPRWWLVLRLDAPEHRRRSLPRVNSKLRETSSIDDRVNANQPKRKLRTNEFLTFQSCFPSRKEYQDREYISVNNA